MSVQEDIASLLPTKAARLVALATLALAGLGFYAPHHLSPLWPKSTQAEIVLAQILVPALIGLLGSWIVLYLVVARLHTIERDLDAARRQLSEAASSGKIIAADSLAPLPAAKPQLTSQPVVELEKVRVDLLLAVVKVVGEKRHPNDDATTERLANIVGVGKDVAEYHLTELMDEGYVYNLLNIARPTAWRIDHKGREYLIKRGLLS